VRASRARTDNLAETLREKLSEVCCLAKRHNVTAVVHGGDIFHSHTQSVGVMRLFLQFLQQLPCPFYTIIGNHDCVGRNQKSLDNTLLGLIASVYSKDKFRLLTSEDCEVNFGPFKLYGLSIEADLDRRHKVILKDVSKPSILVIHNMLVPQSFPSEHVPIRQFQTNAQMVLCAHYHPGFPITTIKDTTFVAPGALCRLEASTYNLQRIPQVALITYDHGFQAEYIPLSSAKEGKEIFDVRTNQSLIQIQESMKSYVSSIEDMDAMKLLELDQLPQLIGNKAGFGKEIIQQLEKLLKEVK